MNKNIILYHGDCIDGLASKMIALGALGDNAICHPVFYGDPIPDLPIDKETTVFILDFSYPRDVLLTLKEKVARLVVLDHHDTAEEDLKGLDFAIFSKDKCGAALTAEFFYAYYGCFQQPHLLKLIQDYDLWQFKYPETKPLMAVIYEHPERETREFWDKLFPSAESYAVTKSLSTIPDRSAFFKELLVKGNFLLEQQQRVIDDVINNKKYTIHSINQFRVALVTAAGENKQHINAVCDALLKNPVVEYVIAMFVQHDGSLKLSFRSRIGGVDVAREAQYFGGGGRQSTAGALIKYPNCLSTLTGMIDSPIVVKS